MSRAITAPSRTRTAAQAGIHPASAMARVQVQNSWTGIRDRSEPTSWALDRGVTVAEKSNILQKTLVGVKAIRAHVSAEFRLDFENVVRRLEMSSLLTTASASRDRIPRLDCLELAKEVIARRMSFVSRSALNGGSRESLLRGSSFFFYRISTIHEILDLTQHSQLAKFLQ